MKPNPQLGKVTFLDGQGELSAMEITTPWSRAEIYFHGAHVTQFQKHGEPPLLFLSQCSRFEKGAPIRGGIPIILPWFGKPADKPGQHGIARIREWELKEVVSPADGSVILRLKLSEQPELPGCALEYVVGVSDTLTAELIVANKSTHAVKFENCLHTYFTVGDINAVSVAGLKGVDYLDSLENRKRKTEAGEAIRFTGEVDRIYVNSTQPVEIRDEALRRVIRVEKQHSQSTVVWNPWIAKAKAMSDYGDDEYQRMVCVESGNVAMNEVTLVAGQTASLKVKLSVTAWT
ncbi:MAG TPA: D-hexose-6-phosphate mutarotase [Verrucomicrobiae bacterium]|nr:D-hexose-6-phosphate mutarotase [Verrucomicrobiae bacterium]